MELNFGPAQTPASALMERAFDVVDNDGVVARDTNGNSLGPNHVSEHLGTINDQVGVGV